MVVSGRKRKRINQLIDFDGVWQKGEDGNDHPISSGIYKLLGGGQKLTVFQQQEIAIKYLSTNRVALKTLSQHPDITTFVPGLHYRVELEDNIIGFCMSPSALLIRQALDTGLDITLYVILDRSQECEPDWESK